MQTRTLFYAWLMVAALSSCDDGANDCGWATTSTAYTGIAEVSATVDPASNIDSDAGTSPNNVFAQASANASISWNPNADQTDSNGDACDETGTPVVAVVGGCQIDAAVTSASYTAVDSDNNSGGVTFDWASANVSGGTCTVATASGDVTFVITGGTIFWGDPSSVRINVAGNVAVLAGADASITSGYATYTFNGKSN